MGGGQGASAAASYTTVDDQRALCAWNGLHDLVDQMSLQNAFFSPILADSALACSVSGSSVLD